MISKSKIAGFEMAKVDFCWAYSKCNFWSINRSDIREISNEFVNMKDSRKEPGLLQALQ